MNIGELISNSRTQLTGVLTDAEINALAGIQLPLNIFMGMDPAGQLTVLTRQTGLDGVICQNLVLPIILGIANQHVQISVAVTGPLPIANPADPVAQFNLNLGRRNSDRRFMPDIRDSVWVAVLESTGLRQWLVENFDPSSAGYIQNQALKAQITQWLRQVNVQDHSAFIGTLEILGQKTRREATLNVVDMLASTELDTVMAAIAEYRRGANRAGVLQVLGLNGVTSRDLPDPDELAHQIQALFEDLNRLYAKGLHSQNALALIQEYRQIIYPAMADADFVAGIKGVRVGNRTAIEALQDHMPQSIRFGLQMAQHVYMAIDRLTTFDENTDLNAQYLDLSPLAQNYGLAAKDYGRTLDNKLTLNGFVGVVGLSATIKLRLGGVNVQVSVGINAGSDPRFTYRTNPYGAQMPGKNDVIDLANALERLTKAHLGGSSQLLRNEIIAQLPPELAELALKVEHREALVLTGLSWAQELSFNTVPNSPAYHGLGATGSTVNALSIVLMGIASKYPNFRPEAERYALHFVNRK